MDEKPTLARELVNASIKGGLGLVPLVGPLLSELVGVGLPQRRLERLEDFAARLETRIGTFEHQTIADAVRDGRRSEVIEETLRQAASAASAERREYLARLLANGLTSDEITTDERRHLLRILGELTDVEVIWLRYYLDTSDSEFRARHREVLELPSAIFIPSQSGNDRTFLAASFTHHLARLGLLDSGIGNRGVVLTPLGHILLREIGLAVTASASPSPTSPASA